MATCSAEEHAQQALIACKEVGELLCQAAQSLTCCQRVPGAHIRLPYCFAGLGGRLAYHIEHQLTQTVWLLEVCHQTPVDCFCLLHATCLQCSLLL